ncbi:DUF4231 domain-containing protein [Vibrio parahaemolyticus]|nr:DUF4231 domain-containing protein [Vibrio parahaemolyticus]ELA9889999.1 DUF4231 domain-containing protein [Vibrio parahaemolyticus]MBM4950824.1 DUF4231 domain-containing protein [Vibrio parahaemolyticus]
MKSSELKLSYMIDALDSQIESAIAKEKESRIFERWCKILSILFSVIIPIAVGISASTYALKISVAILSCLVVLSLIIQVVVDLSRLNQQHKELIDTLEKRKFMLLHLSEFDDESEESKQRLNEELAKLAVKSDEAFNSIALEPKTERAMKISSSIER